MTQEVVDYFKSRGIRVMLSIGGITYTDDWDAGAGRKRDTARAQRARGGPGSWGWVSRSTTKRTPTRNWPGCRLSSTPIARCSLTTPPATNHAARLTIDLGAGDRWLIASTATPRQLAAHRTTPVLDYANAMVRPAAVGSGTPADWQEHIERQAELRPAGSALAPAKLTGGLYLKGETAELQQLRLLGAEGGRDLRPDRAAERRTGDDRRHAGLIDAGLPAMTPQHAHRNS